MKDEIINELKTFLSKVDYNLANLDIDIEAYTDPLLPFVYFNMENGSIFALTEEYFHIKHKHTGRLIWTDNDERNPNEREAWNSALSWLKQQWDTYVGNDNYYDFMISFGVPVSLEPSVKQEFGVIEYNFSKETHLN